MSFKQTLKSDLKRSNGLKLIRSTLSTLLYSYMRCDDSITEQLLPAVKDILLDLVDDIWNVGQKIFERKNSVEVIKKQYSGSVSRKRIVSSDYHSTGKSNLNTKFSEVVSEFSYPKGPTFAKSIREIDKKVIVTPGPACYKNSRSDLMNTPPRVVFPTVTKRDSYIPASLSPGPAKYYSNLRSVSKA